LHVFGSLTFTAALAPGHDALVTLVQRPVLKALGANSVAGAGLAALLAGHALQPFLVGVESVWTANKAFVLPGISTRAARDAVLVRRAIAGGASRVAEGTSVARGWDQLQFQTHLSFSYSLVILRFVRVQGTGRVALVLMHDQVVVTAGAELGMILA